MSRCAKLLKKAKANPASLTFSELIKLAECYNFVFSRISGDHHIYKHTGFPRGLDIQPLKGMAKVYQVIQLRNMIEVMEESTDEEDSDE
jgi:predicted RNA binding protein YcfA (HicA-like mRNA interferase family)